MLGTPIPQYTAVCLLGRWGLQRNLRIVTTGSALRTTAASGKVDRTGRKSVLCGCASAAFCCVWPHFLSHKSCVGSIADSVEWTFSG